jgi:hypothetical protein
MNWNSGQAGTDHGRVNLESFVCNYNYTKNAQ